MTILDGKKLAEQIRVELKKEIAKLNYTPKLSIIMVGESASWRTASKAYIEQKKKVGKDLGVDIRVYAYPESITTKTLRQKVGLICRKPKMRGVIVQLPLPEHINTQSILDAVLPDKDVDVLGCEQSGKFYTGKSTIFPPTAAGIMRLLEEYEIPIEGRQAVVVGYGRLVGKPVAHLLAQKGATVAIINTNSKSGKEVLKNADIIISGVGAANTITKDMVKKGAAIIDAGTSEQDGKLVGDVSSDVAEVAGYITPVPGGVGPMTVAMLFWNLLVLTKTK